MERRKFIELTGKLSLGSIFIPTLIAGSCRKETLFEDLDYNGKVIIVGAGAAGLYAAYILKSKGIDFEILEASSRIGGRIGKLSGFADYTLDLGAQWLHGKNNIIGDYIKANKINISEDNSSTVFWFKQKLVNSLPNNVSKIFEVKEGLPDISFDAHRVQKGFGDEYEFIVENLAGDQGADASQLSVYGNIKDEGNWSSGENDFKFRESFFDVFNSQIIPLVEQQVKLDTIVSSIDYSNDSILIKDNKSTEYIADKVILTVPITILQDEDIQFTPSLTNDKLNAFKKIGMGPGMKVFLKFTERFYHENIIGGEVCAAYADEKTGKNGNDHVLLAFIMGDQAQHLTSLTNDTDRVNVILAELDTMYQGKATQKFIKAHVEDWTSNPYAKGAYSYATVGMGNAREVSAESIDKKIFFAGEAMNLNGHHQTVHGAVETGYREVIGLLNSVKK